MMAAQVQNPSEPSDQLQQFISQVKDLIAESELYIAVIENTKESCTFEGSQNRHDRMNTLIERHVIATEVVERQLFQLNFQSTKMLSSHQVKKNDYEEKLEKELKGLREKLQLMKVHVNVISLLQAERAEFESTFIYDQEVLGLKTGGVNELSSELKASRHKLEDWAIQSCYSGSLPVEIKTEDTTTSQDHLQNLKILSTASFVAEAEVDQQATSEDRVGFETSEGIRKVQLLFGNESEEQKTSEAHQDAKVESDNNDVSLNEGEPSNSKKSSVRKFAEKRLPCSTCGKTYRDQHALKRHELTHTGEKPFTCDVCGKGFLEQGYLTKHKRIHTGEKPFKCDVCNKRFTQRCHLTLHMRGHTGEKPYACDVCGKTFAAQHNVTMHKKTHTGIKPYTCEVCGKGCTNLTEHMRQHTGEKPYICDVCGKSYSSQVGLTLHIKIHTGERPYKCDVCGSDFAYQNSLTYHMRIHTGERPYICDICGETFRVSSALHVHKRSHSGEKPYICEMCGTGFGAADTLKRHMRKHTGERPFACDLCGKAFTQQTSLTYHKRTHTGERPYTCDICGKGFIVSGCLTVHMRTHTNEKS